MLASAVVASRRVGIAVTHQLLHSGEIGTGIEQIARKAAPQVMGRETGDA